ncbi:MAG TPA: hypothetical protein VLG66_09565 [Alphaproteobacteria bacterium]|nr:hypothetical protein [Alphaproteobacteria bacterium]
MSGSIERLGQTLRLILLLAALLFGGIAIGAWLAEWLAPGSWLAAIVGFIMLPLCFGLGMTSWYAIAHAAVMKRLGRAVWRGAKGEDFRGAVKSELADLAGRTLPGTGVFVPIAALVSLGGGAVIGLAPNSGGFFLSLIVNGGVGTAYGFLLRWLAVNGHLPLPEDA